MTVFIKKLLAVKDKATVFVKKIPNSKSKVFIGIISILVLSGGIGISVYAFSRSHNDNTKNLEKDEPCLTEVKPTETQSNEISAVSDKLESVLEVTVTERNCERAEEKTDGKEPEIIQSKSKSDEEIIIHPNVPEQKSDVSSSIQISQSTQRIDQDSNNTDPYCNGSKDWDEIGREFEGIKRWKEIDRFNVDSDSNGSGNYWIIREADE